MSSNTDRAARWMSRALGLESRDLSPNGSVFYRGDTIYSYGEHFPMAIVMREKPNREAGYLDRASPTVGEPQWVLVNGDSYSITTSGHQGMVRGVVSRSGLPSVIVPFSALSAAGIEPTSIELLHVRPDRNEELSHTAERVTGDIAKRFTDYREEEYEDEEYVWEEDGHTIKRDPEGHAVKRPVTKTRRVPEYEEDPNVRYLNQNSRTIARFSDSDGLWHWTTHRHWLGDSLFSAKVHGRRERVRFLSSFDYQEARALYFLCELPRTPVVETVEQAFEALKPPSVKDAEAAGLNVSRQGDMFAIPTELTTKEAKKLTPYGKGRIVKRPPGGLLETNHSASEVIFATEGRVYARGLLYHEPDGLREPDHARRKMGDGQTWHLLVRNMVPRQRTDDRSAQRV